MVCDESDVTRNFSVEDSRANIVRNIQDATPLEDWRIRVHVIDDAPPNAMFVPLSSEHERYGMH